MHGLLDEAQLGHHQFPVQCSVGDQLSGYFLQVLDPGSEIEQILRFVCCLQVRKFLRDQQKTPRLLLPLSIIAILRLI